MFSPLVWIDCDYDRQCAGRNGSRYRSYLEARAERFTDSTGREHAMLAWEIANSPVMSPGFVRIRPDLEHVRLGYDGDGYLMVRIGVRLRRQVLPRSVRYASDVLADWASVRCWNEAADEPMYAFEHPIGDALLVSTEIVRRLETTDFTDPPGDRLDVELAVHTTENITEQIEHLAAALVAALREAQ
jgi:hypothetical protein